jgi:hypothetical protein
VASSTWPAPPTQSRAAMRTTFAPNASAIPSGIRSRLRFTRRRSRARGDPGGLEEDHETEPVRPGADRRDDHAEVADLDDVRLRSHRHTRRQQPEQRRGAAQRGLRQDAPQLLGTGSGAPGEHADRDREQRMCPAAEEDRGEPGRRSEDPERDGPGDRGKGEHPHDRGRRRGWCSGTEDRVRQGGGERESDRLERRGRPGSPRSAAVRGRPGRRASSQHPPRRERAEDHRNGEPDGVDEPDRRPVVGRSTRNERIRYSTRSSGGRNRPSAAPACVCVVPPARASREAARCSSADRASRASEERRPSSAPATPGQHDATARDDRRDARPQQRCRTQARDACRRRPPPLSASAGDAVSMIASANSPKTPRRHFETSTPPCAIERSGGATLFRCEAVVNG